MHTTYTHAPVPCSLTPRERQVMEYIALGAPNKAIARALNLSRRTVEHYRANVFHKLGVDNAVGLLHVLHGDAGGWRARMAVYGEERSAEPA